MKRDFHRVSRDQKPVAKAFQREGRVEIDRKHHGGNQTGIIARVKAFIFGLPLGIVKVVYVETGKMLALATLSALRPRPATRPVLLSFANPQPEGSIGGASCGVKQYSLSNLLLLATKGCSQTHNGTQLGGHSIVAHLFLFQV
jgi:hypothetical protein